MHLSSMVAKLELKQENFVFRKQRCLLSFYAQKKIPKTGNDLHSGMEVVDAMYFD